MSRNHSTAQRDWQLLPDPKDNNSSGFWHCVQLYEDDRFLVRTVSHFISQGLQAGEGLIVIATEGHRELIEKQLRKEGLELDQARHGGQYKSLDADATLSELVVDGVPDQARFKGVVGGTIAKMSEVYPRVRVFGEMVARLWAAGQQDAAVRLEGLWGDLAETHAFSLLCGYPIDGFSNPRQREWFQQVCSLHSHVFPTESYSALSSEEARLRAIAQLQQKASSLRAEVAEHKYAEQRLRESESRFRTMADTAPVMIWMSGVDKLCTFFNKGWLDFTGRTIDQELGNGWSEGIHPEDLDHCLGTYVRSFDVRQNFAMEYRLRRNDGTYRWLLDHGTPNFERDGRFLGYVGSCIDVTELKETGQTLHEIQTRYRMATEAGRVGVWDLNLETGEIYVDPQLKELLGLRQDDTFSHLDDWTQRLPPEELRPATALARAHIRGETSFYEFEHRVLDKDGNIRWLWVRGRLPRHGNGTARHMLGTYTETTEQKKAELEVERQRNELAHLSRFTMLGTLSGALAHELNQPLTAILSNAQAAQRFLAEDSPNLDEVRDILTDIVEDDRRASEVIKRLQLLLMKRETQHQPVDLNELVQDALRLVRADLVANGVTVIRELALKLPAIDGDRVQLQQVLLNLFINACSAMADCASEQRVLVVRTAPLEKDGVQVSVDDQGGGIPLPNLERIFDPFFTTRAQGLGFGLTICRAIVVAHGGKLWAENNRDGGASLHFTLPA